LLGLCVAIVSTSCNKPKPPKSVDIKGKVTLDGKALPDGEVTFALESGGVPSVLPIKDGAFSGQAKTGKNRVSISAYKQGPPLSTDPNKTPTKKNYIADRFNSATKLTAEVSEGGANDFTFDVSAK